MSTAHLGLAGRITRSARRRLNSLGEGLRAAFNLPTRYADSGFAIYLPPGHLLPAYQRSHRLYDRFLPHLVKYLGDGDVVLDVGANCGDTLAAMAASNPGLNYVCIEPDDTFFSYLQRNKRIIERQGFKGSIRLIQTLVGKRVTSATLAGKGGTKSAQVANGHGAGVHRSMSLEDIADELATDAAPNVRLLKSDVDGYDYDVIDSAGSLLERCRPLLFFECQYNNPAQKAGFLSTLQGLSERGYRDFWMFDNFGNPVMHTTQLATVAELIDYVGRQNNRHATRTIHYFDILACASAEADRIKQVVQDYVDMAAASAS